MIGLLLMIIVNDDGEIKRFDVLYLIINCWLLEEVFVGIWYVSFVLFFDLYSVIRLFVSICCLVCFWLFFLRSELLICIFLVKVVCLVIVMSMRFVRKIIICFKKVICFYVDCIVLFCIIWFFVWINGVWFLWIKNRWLV